MVRPRINPQPLVLGDNNVWPLRLAESEGGGWLLVDAGFDEANPPLSSWNLLVEQARAQDIALADVRIVVVTHEHIDHAGLAARWASLGARIVAGRAGIETLVLGAEANERQRESRFADLRRHGAPDEALKTWRGQRGQRLLRWDPCPREAIAAAEESGPFQLAGGETLRLVMAPGHTPGNLIAHVAETGELFSGDTVIPTTIPTAGLHFPGAVLQDATAPRWPSLPQFLRSVASLRALDIDRIYPGHGSVINTPSAYLDRFEAHHRRRARLIRDALSDTPTTAFEVTRTVFPRLPLERLMQAMTEVLGHLDLLVEDGQIEARIQEAPEQIIRWVPVRTGE